MSGGFIGQCGINAPDAPTIGTPTSGNAVICVPFTAPTCTGGGAVTGYVATAADSSGNSIGVAGTCSPIQVTGLTNCTAYTVQVLAKNAYGSSRSDAFPSSVTPVVPAVGQDAYTTAGTYCWTAPSGLCSVSVVAVGAGGGGQGLGGGSGGGLGYKNNISVTSGSSYSVVVGAGGCTANLNDSYFCSVGVVKGGGGRTSACRYADNPGGTYTGDGGGCGGYGGQNYEAGGGGGGGYSGSGGGGGDRNEACGQNGSGGGGGGGSGGGTYGGSDSGGSGGGGVGILGSGTNGSGGTACSRGGSGGSCGASGVSGSSGDFAGKDGGAYGGGGGGTGYGASRGDGAVGAVRIIYPGDTRSFPSTCTGDL